MNRQLLEAITKAAPEIRPLLRTAAEAQSQEWLEANLPTTHNLPSPEVLAGQIVALRDAVRLLLRRQEERYIEYVREHPPALWPVAKDALSDLPPETALTYHAWLEDVTLRREWWDDEERRFEVDVQELGTLLRQHLEEAIGTGGEAGLRAAGGLPPGFASLGEKEAAGLLRQLGAFENSLDVGARSLYRALVDRAASGAVQGAILRDAAGRPVAVATFKAAGKELTVRYLGALDAAVPGSGVQMIRELAGLAASKGQGLVLWAPGESEAVFSGLGFSREPFGRFALSAQSALEVAQTPPGSLAAWTRVGWLEGPEATLFVVDETKARALLEQVRSWADQGGNRVGLAVEALEGAGGDLFTTVALEDETGRLLGVAYYHATEEGPVLIDALAAAPDAPPGTGRRLMREISAVAAKENRALALQTLGESRGLYERLGMKMQPNGFMFFEADEVARFASGLTRGAIFIGQMSWELAVAGASDYLENVVIPGVVESVSTTTHQQLLDTLVEGLERGEGTSALIARIRALDETTFSLARAERIARTEVITANRAGGHQIGRDAGCTEHKWVSRLATNTRAWHREAHGQVRPYDQPFVVSNGKGDPERLMFPGDRSLGAGPDNVINCACAELSLKPGVSDDTAYDEHGTAGTLTTPGPVVAAIPEEVGKRARTRLQDLRGFLGRA